MLCFQLQPAALHIGPLHLHTAATPLTTLNRGVVDHSDGTYTVRFTPRRSGFYQLVIKLGGEQVSSNKAGRCSCRFTPGWKQLTPRGAFSA